MHLNPCGNSIVLRLQIIFFIDPYLLFRANATSLGLLCYQERQNSLRNQQISFIEVNGIK